jgi:D-xylose transport system substrate-binding protein
MKSRRIILSLIMIMVMATTILGSVAAQERPTVGFILAGFGVERFYKDQEFFFEAADRYGVDVLFDTSDDDKVQLDKAQNMIARGIKALVFLPVDSLTAKTVVDVAHKYDVPVIAYDRNILNSDVDYYVTQDSYEVGRLQAEAAAKWCNNKGKVVICAGTKGNSVAEEITRGARETIEQKYPNMKVVLLQYHPNWGAEEAMATVENALTRFGMVDAILCNNSLMARGVVQALQAEGLAGKVFVAGADADLANCQYIVQGLQQYEVLKDIKPLAEKAAQVAADVAYGREVKYDALVDNGRKEVPAILTPVYGFDADNIDEVIIESGFHAREDVYIHVSN